MGKISGARSAARPSAHVTTTIHREGEGLGADPGRREYPAHLPNPAAPVMILAHRIKACLAPQPCDLRKSFDMLRVVMREQLRADPLSRKLSRKLFGEDTPGKDESSDAPSAPEDDKRGGENENAKGEKKERPRHE